MNNIVALGRLGGDPQVNTTNNGTQVVKFNLACNNNHREDDGTYGTNWYNCSMFGKRGDVVAKNFHKGDPILVSGDLVIRKYNDRNGVERTSVDIAVNDFSFVGGRKTDVTSDTPNIPVVNYAQPQAPAMQYNAAPAQAPANDPDDLPF